MLDLLHEPGEASVLTSPDFCPREIRARRSLHPPQYCYGGRVAPPIMASAYVKFLEAFYSGCSSASLAHRALPSSKQTFRLLRAAQVTATRVHICQLAVAPFAQPIQRRKRVVRRGAALAADEFRATAHVVDHPRRQRKVVRI